MMGTVDSNKPDVVIDGVAPRLGLPIAPDHGAGTAVDDVRANEPATLGHVVTRDSKDPCAFTASQRFADQAAMDAHNGSAALKRLFGIANPILEGDVVLVTGEDISSKI